MSTPSRGVAADDLDASRAIIALLRGVIQQPDEPQLWAILHRNRSRIADHVGFMGLDLVVDDQEGYAYLRQGRFDDELPPLVPRHRLSFSVSLTLALLRKQLAEFDAYSTEPRLLMSRDEIHDLVARHSNTVAAKTDTVIAKAVELRFLRLLPGDHAVYEVQRILKAYIDGQWLADFDERLRDYLESDSRTDAENTGAIPLPAQLSSAATASASSRSSAQVGWGQHSVEER